mmetsp:Transcript_10649/g.24225  ORF Transcript_10649/g.24225 Transcript_10649/m.24225 type:complete len:293 (-) Transcript_10649:149-1027(-)
MKVIFGCSLLTLAASVLLERSEMQLQSTSQELALMFAGAAKYLPFGVTRSLLESFEICGACSKWERFGEFNDGGYLMCRDKPYKAPPLQVAFSMGVEHHDQWSEDVVNRLNIPVYQMDCTVIAPPEGCRNCHFFRKCLRAADGHDDNFPDRSWSLADALAAANVADAPERSLLMKMDIESSEWAIFEVEHVDLLRKFQQVVVEFHGLRNEGKHDQMLKAIRTILAAGFQVAHLHGNNYAGMYRVGNYQIPNVLEVTFTSGETRETCSHGQQYYKHLDHSNTGGREMDMAKLP